jgi:hypothetical protein
METSEKKDSDLIKKNLVQAMIVAAREEFDCEHEAAVEEARKQRDKKKRDDEFLMLLFSQ